MKPTVESLQARINLLQQRDAVANVNIIRKLMRQIRKLENQ